MFSLVYSEKNVPEARWNRIFQKQMENLPDYSEKSESYLIINILIMARNLETLFPISQISSIDGCCDSKNIDIVKYKKDDTFMN